MPRDRDARSEPHEPPRGAAVTEVTGGVPRSAADDRDGPWLLLAALAVFALAALL